MNATTRPAMEQLTSATQDQGMKRVSVLEQSFGAFYDRTLDAARNDDGAKFKASPLMGDLNQIRTTLAGLGAVMRIVTGNSVQVDNFDPADQEAEPPISRVTEGMLTEMMASVCELLVDKIDRTAYSYNERETKESKVYA